CRPNRGLPIRSAWAANFKGRRRTAGVSRDTTISWKLSEIQPTRNMRTCWIGWAANLIPRHSQSMMSIGDAHLSNAGGQKPERCATSRIWKFIADAPLPKAHVARLCADLKVGATFSFRHCRAPQRAIDTAYWPFSQA